jgi:hypothetical protein
MTTIPQQPEYLNEDWKKVSFEGICTTESYQVSNYGRIRIYKKKKEEWRILKTADVKGYRYFTFKSDDQWTKKITKPVHRLVADAFCKKKTEDTRFVIHIDYVKDNNYYKNLKWVTQWELTQHNHANPTVQKSHRKGVIRNSKLTEAQVIRLKKKLLRSKSPLYKIAKEFGITHTQLNRIRRGENWGHVKID